MSHCFRLDGGLRPSRYRTPSPPRAAYEVLSPFETLQQYTAWEDALSCIADSCYLKTQDAHPSLDRSALLDSSISRLNRGRTSSDDVLYASTPTAVSVATTAKRHAANFNADRVGKRAKSEAYAQTLSLPVSTNSCRNSLPGIAAGRSAPERLDAAELLLGFSRGARTLGTNLSLQASDTQVPHTCNETSSEPAILTSRAISQANSNYSTEEAGPARDAHSRDPTDEDPVCSRLSPLPLLANLAHEVASVRAKPSEAIRKPQLENGTLSPPNELFEPLKIKLEETRPKNQGVTRPKWSIAKAESCKPQALNSKPSSMTSGRSYEETQQSSLDNISQIVSPHGAKLSDPPDLNLSSIKKGFDVQGSANERSVTLCGACGLACDPSKTNSTWSKIVWIGCESCKSWFHLSCAGVEDEKEVRRINKFRCQECATVHGATTYVRKSSRAHTAIDYAGLHQGIIKTSDDDPRHHYIQPIKEGRMKFCLESFPRIPAKLVTSEHLQSKGGFREPIVIPKNLNEWAHHDGAHESLIAQSFWRDTHNFNHSTNHDDEISLASQLHSAGIQLWRDELDMIMPRDLSIRQVAALYGPDEKIEVIDVKSQNGENRKWTLRKWADYYEDPSQDKIVRNVISLEISRSRLGAMIQRPQIVRELDMQDAVWPHDTVGKTDFPQVQLYCLMSVADCYTDFHIDFGGSSVFYHILKGKKTFFFIPPKEKHLKKYEEWCMSPEQNWTFLGDSTNECYRVDLVAGDTMLIPSGWIHAVWTPEDSLVIGGNFLTRRDYGMQFRISQLEKLTGVSRKFRYPHFQKLHWYAAIDYMKSNPIPQETYQFLRTGGTIMRPGSAQSLDSSGAQESRMDPSISKFDKSELDGLPDLLRYLLRTLLIDLGKLTDGISTESRKAVKKSIPRGFGDPLQLLKDFAIWCAWQRGGEPTRLWAQDLEFVKHALADAMQNSGNRFKKDLSSVDTPHDYLDNLSSSHENLNDSNRELPQNLKFERTASGVPGQPPRQMSVTQDSAKSEIAIAPHQSLPESLSDEQTSSRTMLSPLVTFSNTRSFDAFDNPDTKGIGQLSAAGVHADQDATTIPQETGLPDSKFEDPSLSCGRKQFSSVSRPRHESNKIAFEASSQPEVRNVGSPPLTLARSELSEYSSQSEAIAKTQLGSQLTESSSPVLSPTIVTKPKSLSSPSGYEATSDPSGLQSPIKSPARLLKTHRVKTQAKKDDPTPTASKNEDLLKRSRPKPQESIRAAYVAPKATPPEQDNHDLDAASMNLIRMLQAQELGLRRRA